ncbi:MAG: single-stranded DNA-binding protein [Bacteroidales bacterium]|jgi:single-strand DNA-binding protein|nr:single-stranded DNA-binding protein [Bacteroidales bacterium]
MSINKVILVGNVGKDPVVRYFDKGVAKASFPLATSETFTNQQGETITSTEWHNIVLWRSLAEVAEKTVRKGTQLYIVGKIKTRSYVDKDGNNKYITEILADTMLVLEKKTGTQENGRTVSQERGSQPEVNEPGTSYRSRQTPDDTDAGQTGPFGDATGTGQSEDDLPF